MYKVSIMSGKGGVGKTTTCLGTALALKDLGYRPAILDIDLENPSLGIACGKTRDDLVFKGEYITPPRWEGIPIMSLSLLPLEDFKDTPTLIDEERKLHVIQALFREVDWGETDYLLIDMPPGSGEEVRGLMKLTPDGIVIITSPQELSEAAVRRVVMMAREYDLRILGLVENDVNSASGDAGKNVAEAFGLPLLTSIDWSPDFSTSTQKHEPFVCAPFLEVAEAIADSLPLEVVPREFVDLTDDQWGRVAQVIPEQTAGRARSDDRMVVNGICFVINTVTPWAKAPEAYGPWKTLWNRHDAWDKSGVWAKILAAIQGEDVESTTDGAGGELGPEDVLREGCDTGERTNASDNGTGEVSGCGGEVSGPANSEAAAGSEQD